MRTKDVTDVIQAQAVMEGAGVKVHRTIAHPSLDYVDPFLLLDEFKSDDPQDFIAGFPWHPHRGIETVTYMIAGQVEHGDSVGNTGVIGPGDMQWMTAGGGIVHQEMPLVEHRRVEQRTGEHPPGSQKEIANWGLQLWVNLPASDKMCRPRYQEVRAEEIPHVDLKEGGSAALLCGKMGDVEGPVKDVATDPLYLDVQLPPNTKFSKTIPRGYSVFCYCLDGKVGFGSERAEVNQSHIVLFGEGDEVQAESGGDGARFLLVSGRILNEPVARGGPFVMNTREEIEQAFRDYREGTFLK